MANQNAKRDDNRITTLLGVTDDVSAEIRRLLIDPSTGRLKVSATISTNIALDDLSDVTITSAAQGDILYRNATAWVNLAAGTTGKFLKTQGAGANPIWDTPTAAAAGSDTQVQFNDGGAALGGDAGFTYNKTTDSATLVGSMTVGTGVLISTNDAGAIGASGTAFSDLFLASGGVINWAAGNATLTHSTGLLTSNVPLSLGTSNAFTAGSIELGAASDTTLTRASAGVLAVEGKNVYMAGGTDVSVADGGTGLSTITALSIWVANSANTITEVTPGAGNSIRINAGGTAWEAFTPSASVPASITVANEATDTTCFIGFFTAATGDLGPKTNTGLTYNSNTNVLTATTFVGALTGTASGNLVSGGALGTPSSGTLTNCTGLPIAGLTASTSTALGVGSIELGHASDTTIARVSAGVVSIEGVNILTVAGGTLTGNITLGENTAIALDPAGSADGKYTGITITATAGYAQTYGDLVYLDPTDSRWEKTDANSAAAADGDARGTLGIVVVAGAADGNACTVLLHGVIRADAAFPTFTVNNPVYVSETAGTVTQTQPTTTDAVIRVVGFALTTDEMFFNPSGDYITHT